MRRSIGRRAAVIGCGVAALLAVGVPTAFADTSTPASPAPSYGPITLSQQEAQQLCGSMLPNLLSRTEKMLTRINGGADVKGSVAWLKAQAESQRAKGHTERADRLDQRATRRAARADDLRAAQQRLNAFKTAHCEGK